MSWKQKVNKDYGEDFETPPFHWEWRGSVEGLSEQTRWYVNTYQSRQSYGGPEEGGWWYDQDESRTSTPFSSKESAQVYLQEVQLLFDERNKEEHPYGRHSVNEDGWNIAKLEEHPALDYPTFRPIYC